MTATMPTQPTVSPMTLKSSAQCLISDILTQKIAVAVVSEDTAIVGEEAFANPVSTDEVTLGYYASRQGVDLS